MIVKIPDRLNGKTFYGEILPSIYKSIIEGNYSIDFDMHRTELANPEGLVNHLAVHVLNHSIVHRKKHETMSLTLAPKSVHRPKDGNGKVINNEGIPSLQRKAV